MNFNAIKDKFKFEKVYDAYKLDKIENTELTKSENNTLNKLRDKYLKNILILKKEQSYDTTDVGAVYNKYLNKGCKLNNYPNACMKTPTQFITDTIIIGENIFPPDNDLIKKLNTINLNFFFKILLFFTDKGPESKNIESRSQVLREQYKS